MTGVDHVGSSMMGELFSTVIERQFLKLRNGDRFWFERPSMNSQEEISARRVFCVWRAWLTR